MNEREKEWSRRYWQKHGDTINQRRRIAYKKAQGKTLAKLLNDYNSGLNFDQLCDKYKVLERKGNNV